MPISTPFDRKDYARSVEAILREWLADFFPPAVYVITFEAPAGPSKPTLWLQWLPGRNRAIRERARNTTVQGKQLSFVVSALARDRNTALRVGAQLEAAVLASASSLASAGLRYVQVQPFQEIVVEADATTYRRVGTLTCTVEI